MYIHFYVEIVPHYDGQNVAESSSMFTDLVSLATRRNLPQFGDELSPGTIVLAGHTINSYSGTSGPSLSFNIQWIVVLAK